MPTATADTRSCRYAGMATAQLPSPSSDRRQHPRIDLTWDTAVGYTNEWELVQATVEDVSGGGTCIRTTLNPTPGDELLVVLSLEDETIAALARVVRSEAAGPDTFKLHLQFRWLQESSRHNLARLFAP